MSAVYKLMVEGERTMHCGGCSGSVEFALSQLQGVTRVKADHKTQLIEIEADQSISPAQVIGELSELGYVAKEV